MLLLLACALPDPTPPPTSGDVRVLTYNVHGFPSAITGDDTAARMAAIGPLLGGYDVVGLQEAWDQTECVDVLDETTPLDDAGAWDEPLEGRAYGTGLRAYAGLPVSRYDGGYYDTCYGVFDNANDCLASKGWLRSTLSLADGVEVDLVDTHLDAGNDQGDDAARATQVDELLAALATDRPVVLLGDMNMEIDDPEDAPILDEIAQAGLADACDLVACDDPTRIDHVFVRDGGGVTLSVTAWAVDPDFVDDDGVALSDHDPVGVGLTWARE